MGKLMRVREAELKLEAARTAEARAGIALRAAEKRRDRAVSAREIELYICAADDAARMGTINVMGQAVEAWPFCRPCLARHFEAGEAALAVVEVAARAFYAARDALADATIEIEDRALPALEAAKAWVPPAPATSAPKGRRAGRGDALRAKPVGTAKAEASVRAKPVKPIHEPKIASWYVAPGPLPPAQRVALAICRPDPKAARPTLADALGSLFPALAGVAARARELYARLGEVSASARERQTAEAEAARQERQASAVRLARLTKPGPVRPVASDSRGYVARLTPAAQARLPAEASAPKGRRSETDAADRAKSAAELRRRRSEVEAETRAKTRALSDAARLRRAAARAARDAEAEARRVAFWARVEVEAARGGIRAVLMLALRTAKQWVTRDDGSGATTSDAFVRLPASPREARGIARAADELGFAELASAASRFAAWLDRLGEDCPCAETRAAIWAGAAR